MNVRASRRSGFSPTTTFRSGPLVGLIPKGLTEPDLCRARWPLLLALAFFLSACGFQPRGQLIRLPAEMQPLYLAGLPESHDFMRELRHQLQLSGVQVAKQREEAAALLRIHRLERDREVFSVNANNKAVEFELVYRLAFSLASPPGTPPRKGEPLVARRIIYEPGGELLGRVREAEMREKDVYRDLARRLMRQLAQL